MASPAWPSLPLGCMPMPSICSISSSSACSRPCCCSCSWRSASAISSARHRLAVLAHAAFGAVGLVHQLLLAADHVGELVEALHHLLAGLLVALHRPAGLQVLEHVLELGEELLGGVAGAVLGEVLDLVEHPLEVLRAEHLHVGVGRQVRHVRVPPRLLGHRLQEFLHRLAKLVGEPRDLLVGGAVLQRLAERLLRVAERLCGERQVAVLDAERDRPEIVDQLAEFVVVPRVLEPMIGAAECEIVADVVEGVLGREGQRIERVADHRRGVGVHRELRPLLDDGAGERIGELPRGKRQLDRLASPLLLRLVARRPASSSPWRRPRDGR